MPHAQLIVQKVSRHLRKAVYIHGVFARKMRERRRHARTAAAVGAEQIGPLFDERRTAIRADCGRKDVHALSGMLAGT